MPRFLDTKTMRFRWVEDPRDVAYAILSHVWTKANFPGPPEQSYADITAIHADFPDGRTVDESRFSEKVRMLCKIARRDGYRYVWFDTGCIDRSSSAELSEAINSMYDWYRYAAVCYAYLADVGCRAHPQKPFLKSVWFLRGWTLQELIAPNIVIFLSSEWGVIGTKHSLAAEIERETRIDAAVLTHRRALSTISVARRMSWAARRRTTKVEDEAYCLLGIFRVHLQPVYGEGTQAFIRLQEEICKQIADQTIFAWGSKLRWVDPFSFSRVPRPSGSRQSLRHPEATTSTISQSQKQYLFASSPKAFEGSSRLVRVSPEELARRLRIREAEYPIYTVTPYGLHTRFPLVVASSKSLASGNYLAFLACEDDKRCLVALILRAPNPGDVDNASGGDYVVGEPSRGEVMQMDDSRAQNVVSTLVWRYNRVVALPANELSWALPYVSSTDVRIRTRPPDLVHDTHRDRQVRGALYKSMEPVELRLASWCEVPLHIQGYTIEPMPGFLQEAGGRLEPLTLVPGTSPHTLRVADATGFLVLSIGHCPCQHGRDDGYLSVAIRGERESPAIQRVTSVDHAINHPDHVVSWSQYAGYVSKELPSKGPDGLERTVRLSLSRGFEDDDSDANPGDGSLPRSFLVLSVEIKDSGRETVPTMEAACEKELGGG